jgi:hypothetical protein
MRGVLFGVAVLSPTAPMDAVLAAQSVADLLDRHACFDPQTGVLMVGASHVAEDTAYQALARIQALAPYLAGGSRFVLDGESHYVGPEAHALRAMVEQCERQAA